jgi:ketosteroid isomerase-like protein
MFVPQNDAERTVMAFFQALGAGDFAAARQVMAPNMSWKVMGTGVPGAGEHIGPDAIFAAIAPIRALFAPGSPVITLRTLTSNHRTVVMETHGGGLLKDGRVYDNQYVMSLDVEDGRVFALREYMDTFYVNGLGLKVGT